ncbi:hypothetical protein [Altererythrobacter aquiaggeris]|uniref:hypothetical protein n=1 Tax=Aestuarierythrobacter aquiaggeris TaxID=1898396 RepID=UPI003017787F
MSKYSAAIYSCRQADWSQSRWQELPGQTRLVDVLGAYSGEAIVETYTIQPGNQGAAASIVARTPGGSRLAATIDPSDDETLAAMHTADPLGRTINVRQADAMRNFFEFKN